ncbi:MAG: helix-turn-helix domain-containing protein, partial [Xanthobacteraceae bacterium]
MSFQAITWAIEQRAGSPSAKATLWSIANYANEHWCAWPSQKTICHDSEQSPDAVQKRLPELVARGLVRRIPLRFAGRKTVDFFVLAPSRFFEASFDEIEPLLPRGCEIDRKRVAADRGNGAQQKVAEFRDEPEPSVAGISGNGKEGLAAPTLPLTLPQIAADVAALERQHEPLMEPKNQGSEEPIG